MKKTLDNLMAVRGDVLRALTSEDVEHIETEDLEQQILLYTMEADNALTLEYTTKLVTDRIRTWIREIIDRHSRMVDIDRIVMEMNDAIFARADISAVLKQQLSDEDFNIITHIYGIGGVEQCTLQDLSQSTGISEQTLKWRVNWILHSLSTPIVRYLLKQYLE